MSLTPGTRLGSYDILGLLGRGGMGEVYRARDARLRREVAIKVLPDLVASDPDRVERFEREAQLLAALSHPHIAHVYGFEEAQVEPDGSRRPVVFLVMELVEGPTLAELISRAPLSGSAARGDSPHGLPLDDTLSIARQIADALEAAHDKGIIHRDLKPANVKVTPEGEVKILDFGLAKALDPGATSGGVVESPSLTARATQLGVILGTAAYMAPEQARGKTVDRRADVWAFGCVLYEMLTGRRAFEGDEMTDVLARVIEREPDWSALPATTPPAIRELVGRCLHKDAKQRLRDIGEARVAIDTARAGRAVTASGPAAATPPVAAGSGRMTMALGGVAVVATLLAIAGWVRPGATPAGATDPIQVELSLPRDVEFFSTPRLSRDGTRVGFIGVREGIRQVYLRTLSGADTVALNGTIGATFLAFSPDGTMLAVLLTDGRVLRITLATGAVDDLGITADILGAVEWTPDGWLVLGQITRLVKVPGSGGVPEEITTLDTAGDETSIVKPVITPDGRHVIFSSWRRVGDVSQARLEAVPISGGARHVVVDRGDTAVAVADGRLIFYRDGALHVASLDTGSATLTSAPVRVSEDVQMNPSGAPSADVAATGALLFARSGVFHGRLVWVTDAGIERVLEAPARSYQNARVSPDGRRVVFSELGVIWSLDLERGTFTRVHEGSNTLTGFPVWAADNTHVIFRSGDGIYVHRADGEGAPRLFSGTSRQDYPSSVSRDGSTLAFLRITPDTAGDIFLAPLAGGAPRLVVSTRAYEGGPQISPDGNWLAYVSD
ncbi:MAG TPA: protein kinase, partial [Vicinamibacterales bacterium]|nr:protein kinase [Vicinamibacterales bacterium]